jgi:hypothetical protein
MEGDQLMARATTNTKKEEAAPPGAAAAAGLRAIMAELAEMYFEREEEIRALAVALLARQHIVLIGPPGTAKTPPDTATCRKEHARDEVEPAPGGREPRHLEGQ